jgi:hypothetical protein
MHVSDDEEMRSTAPNDVDDQTFYRSAIDVLSSAGIDFLVGGAYAMQIHTGVQRDTKDFDLFIRPADASKVLGIFADAGFHSEHTFPHWLLKVHGDREVLDIIYRAGNGLCEVDDEWFTFSREADFFGVKLRACPPEEMIWQKAFIMERERFDGADVQHLLRSCGKQLDWERLLRRFADDLPVLFSHMILFSYIYPDEHDTVPRSVMERLRKMPMQNGSSGKRICRGTLLSRLQYLEDIERWGYQDARTEPRVRITENELRQWTKAARDQAASPSASFAGIPQEQSDKDQEHEQK